MNSFTASLRNRGGGKILATRNGTDVTLDFGDGQLFSASVYFSNSKCHYKGAVGLTLPGGNTTTVVNGLRHFKDIDGVSVAQAGSGVKVTFADTDKFGFGFCAHCMPNRIDCTSFDIGIV